MNAIRYRRVVHLSHVIGPGMPLWPGDPPVVVEPAAGIEREGYFLQRLCIGEHSGTHLVTARTFFPDGMTMDACRAESLVVPAAVIDVRRQAAANPDFVLPLEDLLDWERRQGPLPPGAVILLHTGWDRRWGDPAAFLNTGPDGRMHFPGFSLPAADWLIQQRQVAGLGTDTHGVDPGVDVTLAVSRRVLGAGGMVLENLAGLDQLPAAGAVLVIGALRVTNGSGAPATVLAFLP